MKIDPKSSLGLMFPLNLWAFWQKDSEDKEGAEVTNRKHPTKSKNSKALVSESTSEARKNREAAVHAMMFANSKNIPLS